MEKMKNEVKIIWDPRTALSRDHARIPAEEFLEILNRLSDEAMITSLSSNTPTGETFAGEILNRILEALGYKDLEEFLKANVAE
jgi:hypothetical protein